MPRGGKRKGAGRSPLSSTDKKIAVSIRFDPELAAWLRAQDNYNKLINELVRRAKEEG